MKLNLHESRIYSHFGGAEALCLRSPEIESELQEALDTIPFENRVNVLRAFLRHRGYRPTILDGVSVQFEKSGVLVGVLSRPRMTRLVADLAIFQYFYAADQAYAGVEIVLDVRSETQVAKIEKVLKRAGTVPAKIVFVR